VKLARNVLWMALVVAPLHAQQSPTEAWMADPAHSVVEFKIRHLVSSVTDNFRDFDAAIALNRDNPAASSVQLTIRTASIDTANKNRDEHLRSPDFFEVSKYPTLTFKSTEIKAKSKSEFDVTGDLTIHGVTKRVTLPVTFLGFARDPRGNERGGFEIETTLNRKDYGLLWNQTLDEGGFLLGDDVKVDISLEVARKKD
jgi:polyisoprenoid-binding protein YceI